MSAVLAARAFVESEFWDEEVAIVSSTFIRGEDTRAFDLDLFVAKKWSLAKPVGPHAMLRCASLIVLLTEE